MWRNFLGLVAFLHACVCSIHVTDVFGGLCVIDKVRVIMCDCWLSSHGRLETVMGGELVTVPDGYGALTRRITQSNLRGLERSFVGFYSDFDRKNMFLHRCLFDMT